MKRPPLHPTLHALADALQDLAAYRPASLGETTDLLLGIAGDGTGQYSLASHLAEIVANLGDHHNPTLRQLPGRAQDLVQTATNYYRNCVVDGDAADVIGEVLTALEEPVRARTGGAFLAAQGVHVDLDPDDAAGEDVAALADRIRHHDLIGAAR